jgi:hypothetical protein
MITWKPEYYFLMLPQPADVEESADTSSRRAHTNRVELEQLDAYGKQRAALCAFGKRAVGEIFLSVTSFHSFLQYMTTSLYCSRFVLWNYRLTSL